MLTTILTVVQVFVSLGIVVLVLLQRGRGADAGAGFGAGASATVFGARGATTGLSRSTAVLAAVFMINSLALAWLGTQRSAAPSGGLLGQPTQSAPLAPATTPLPTAPATSGLDSVPAAAPGTGAPGAGGPASPPGSNGLDAPSPSTPPTGALSSGAREDAASSRESAR